MIRRLIQAYREKKRFTAERCRNHQQEVLSKRANVIIDDIKAFINFKVDNTNEKAVINSLSSPEDKVYTLVEDYYRERGFIVFRTKFKELGDLEFLVISWISNI